MTDSIVPQKHCSNCKRELPATVECFGRASSAKDGLHWQCKLCRHEYYEQNKARFADYQRDYNKRNRGLVAQKRREYRQRNRERIRIYRAEYRAKKHDFVLEICRSYRIRNRDKIAQSSREYSKTHPEIRAAGDHRRRAREQGLPASWTALDWQRSLDYFHHCCAVCGNPLRDLFGVVEPHREHWIAIMDNRPDNPGTVPGNMLPMCSLCNNNKKAKDPIQWLNHRFGKRKANQILKRITAYFDWIKQQS